MADTPHESNGTPQRSEPESQNASLVESLRQELTQVRRELAEVKAERDQYLKYIYSLADSHVEFNEEELLALRYTHEPFLEFVKRLEASSKD